MINTKFDGTFTRHEAGQYASDTWREGDKDYGISIVNIGALKRYRDKGQVGWRMTVFSTADGSTSIDYEEGFPTMAACVRGARLWYRLHKLTKQVEV